MKNKEKVFLLWGQDAEMQQIKKKLEKYWIPHIDKNLWWGASVKDYENEILEILQNGKQAVAIELSGAGEWKFKQVLSIDHHGESAKNPASISQVLKLIGVEPSLEDELIAANDRGYIPEVIRTLEQCWITNPEEQWRHIDYIRSLDRRAQGINSQHEKEAQKAINKKEILLDGDLLIINSTHSKTSIYADKLYGSYSNLLILSDDWKVNFYGNWILCETLHKEFWWWAGNINYGEDSNETAYRGWYPDKDKVKEFIINTLEQIKIIKNK